MSQERYGIRRFALLNTAGYSLGIFPLENPLSVYGADESEDDIILIDEPLEESEEDALARAIAEEKELEA